jgi:quercetin dioxygenase-like cupin family protein/pyrroloquinoline quinone (PQQ) biosynthesis protein C
MANLEDDYYRSQLSENIWEEGGGANPEERHSEIFRKFLREALGIRIEEIHFHDSALRFSGDYLNYCLSKSSLEVSAFLSLGTEAIISRLYKVFIEGMTKGGVEESKLHFFHLHVACDDDHALTLEKILLSFKHEPNWFERAQEGMLAALNMRDKFFHSLFELLLQNKVKSKLQKINARKSLLSDETSLEALCFNPNEKSQGHLYENKNEKHNIDFTVTRAPYPAEVLDARVVRIAPFKNNERHTHAHESIFYVLEGEGVVQVGNREINVKSGDSVFVPRWAVHQTRNILNQEMVILALTDYYLTGDVFIGNYNSTARMKK